MVVRAALEAAHAIGLAGPPGQDDHREIGIDASGEPVGRAHAIEHVQAASALEAQVEQHQAGAAHLDRAQPLGGARRARHPEAVGGQIVGQKALRRLVVLDDQDQPVALLVHARVKDCEDESRPAGSEST